jgi:type IV pilus assembly protein PilE
MNNTGFTLLEMVIVLAIIGLLAAISYPSYHQHILKTRRSCAEIALLNLASKLEEYYTLYNTYTGATLSNVDVSEYTEDNYYKLEITHTAENAYLLQARPQNSQTQDTLCGSLTLNHLGDKNISGSGNISECW